MMGTVDVLTGEYEYTLDSKSRFLMPTEFRDYLGEPMYFVRGFENCIYVYSESQWQKMSEDIRNLPWSSDAARWVKRIWFSSSIKVKADPQGRVLVPQVYRDHVLKSNKVVVLGCFDYVEIWDEEQWRNDASEKIGLLGKFLEEANK
ncbi:division/cell wall cluster transcriptional repressor MraZ [Coprothermobacter platensis]|uniref:division/cell wall cluster transcriptional repressor MraZ n=1 Tax=Coprothermobacter platensis TaxID=108819 RepID=UPI0003629201|nr:division/cell wall cluster transcriptional repressor MraZ [Coprothermobacter platensis]